MDNMYVVTGWRRGREYVISEMVEANGIIAEKGRKIEGNIED